jgi:hypothetical protein
LPIITRAISYATLSQLCPSATGPIQLAPQLLPTPPPWHEVRIALGLHRGASIRRQSHTSNRSTASADLPSS